MAIKFKCPNCQKPLAVKDEMAGKRAVCPACKSPFVIPAPVAPPADVEAFAAAAMAEQPAAAKEVKPPEFVEFDCPFCGDPVKIGAELAGKNAPCPACKHIVKVPLLKVDKPKDWRDINKNGPAAARINLPEQLEGAWGTEAKSRVGRESLEEAGALPEVQIDSIGMAGWIKRGLIGILTVGAITLVVIALLHNRRQKQDKDDILAAHELEVTLAKDPKKKVHPVLSAAIEQADGILQLRQGKIEKARQRFLVARAKCLENVKDALLDQDLFLIDLALLQLDLTGTEEQIRAKIRYDWDPDVLKEVQQTLEKIKTPEAKVMAVRDMSNELIARKQVPRALGLAAKLNAGAAADKNKGALVQAQQVALVLAHGDPKSAEKIIPAPDLSKALPDLPPRLAYAEGNARKGDLKEAEKYTQAKGVASHRFEANVAVAGVILGNKANKEAATQAAPFVAEAFKILEKEMGGGANPWLMLQLCRAAYRIPDHAAEGKLLAQKQLPPNFKRRAQLDWVLAQLEKGNDQAAKELIGGFPDADGPCRGLAWVALGRQFALLGRTVPLPDADSEDAVYRVFANIGAALGKQER